MPAGAFPHDLHACAFNARDPETLAALATNSCRCIRDGKHVGTGPAAVHAALLAEYKLSEDLIGRVMDVKGERALVEYDSGGAARGVMRMRGHGRIEELHIEHDVARFGL